MNEADKLGYAAQLVSECVDAGRLDEDQESRLRLLAADLEDECEVALEQLTYR